MKTGRKYLIAVLLLVQASCKTSPGPGSPDVFVESFRVNGLSDDRVIQAALDAAGEGGCVQFQPNRVYTIRNVIRVKRFQILSGYNATLKRADQTFSQLRIAAGACDSALVLDSVPGSWAMGDQLQLLTDSTGAHSNTFGDLPRLPNLVTRVSGDTVFMSSVAGVSVDGSIRQWPAGTTVRKVYTLLRGDSINVHSVPFTVRDLSIDGNRKNKNLNYYWNVNSTIFTRGAGAQIEHCRFANISNENIVGQGIYITNCQAYHLNGSFVHLIGHRHDLAVAAEKQFHLRQLCRWGMRGPRFRHAAFGGGFYVLVQRRLRHDHGQPYLQLRQKAAFGKIEYYIDTADRGKSDLLITNNLFENCRAIVYSISPIPQGGHPSRNIFIADNIFANCGANDWSSYRFLPAYPGLDIGHKRSKDGTTCLMPGQKKVSDR